MYADRVASCPLVSHIEYAPRALVRLEKRRNRRTDGHQTVTLRSPRLSNTPIQLSFSFATGFSSGEWRFSFGAVAGKRIKVSCLLWLTVWCIWSRSACCSYWPGRIVVCLSVKYTSLLLLILLFALHVHGRRCVNIDTSCRCCVSLSAYESNAVELDNISFRFQSALTLFRILKVPCPYNALQLP